MGRSYWFIVVIMVSILLQLDSRSHASLVVGDIKADWHLDATGGVSLTGVDVGLTVASLTLPVNCIGEPGSVLYWNSLSNWSWSNSLAVEYNVTERLFDLGGTLIEYDTHTNNVDYFYSDVMTMGPTERNVALPKSLSFNYGLVSISPQVLLMYDVTLPTGVNVLMDQEAILDKLTIEHGATLVGDPRMVIRTDLVNSGYFGNLSGTVQGDFYNNGNPANNERAYVNGPLNVNGQLYNTGEIHVTSGLLKLLPAATSNTHDGNIIIEGGSFQYGTTFTNYGTFELHNGSIYGNGAFFNNTGANFAWMGGTLPTSLTNLGTFTIAGPGQKYIGWSSVLANGGTMMQSGDATLSFAGWNGEIATLNNLAGGVYDLQGDGNLRKLDSGNYYGTINNAGTFRKSAGTGESVVDGSVSFNNTGTVDVDSGTLTLNGGGSANSGTFAFANGGRVRLGNGLSLSGANTLSGNGTLEVYGGSVLVPSNGSASFSGQDANLEITGGYLDSREGATLDINLTGSSRVKLSGGSIGGGWHGVVTNHGAFDWTSGNIGGTFTTSGTSTITGPGQKYIGWSSVLANGGTMMQSGDATLSFAGWNGEIATLNNLAGGVYDLQGDGNLRKLDSGNYYGTINNAGTFRKSAGTGESVVDGSVSFNNTGTVDVDSGTLTLNGGVSQLVSNTLTGGTWNVNANSTLNITTGSNITTNQGNVTLDGAGSTFTKINSLSNNQGNFSVLDGRNFTTVGDLANSGTVTVGSGSDFDVSGGITGTGDLIVNGTLTTDSIFQDTFTLGAGARVTIRAIPGGHMAAQYQISPVPEPATISLLILAAVGLGLWRLRRKCAEVE